MSGDLPRLRFKMGDTFRERGARGRIFVYRLVGTAPYATRTGAASALLTWQGQCAMCGADFYQTTGRRPHEMLRTCQRHRGKAPWRWPAGVAQ